MSKVLVIEDSNLIRMQIKNALKSSGFNDIVLFESADDIIENLDFILKDVSLIITDIGLPGTSGIEFAELLHTNPKYNNIPIIFISGHKDAKIINSAIKAGGIDYILKPFTDELLIERVEHILGNPFEKELQKFIIDQDKAIDIIGLEYERAVRGKQPVSFIIIKVEQRYLGHAANLIKEMLRQIDSIFVIDKQLFIILPVTALEGLMVVRKKIKNKLQENNITFKEIKIIPFLPEKRKTLGDLVGQLFDYNDEDNKT